MSDDTDKARGRPLGFDPDTVLDDLVMLFWEKGYDDTTQADMVKRTGLSSSSLYNTFGDKPATFDRVLARYNDMVAAACEPMAGGNSGLAELEAYVDWLEARLVSGDGPSGCLMVATMGECAEEARSVTGRCADYRAIQRDAMSTAIDRAVADGDLTPGDTSVRSALMLAAIIGVGATSRSSPSTEDPLAMLDAIRKLIRSWTPQ
ncbi:MAG: TetR/AcrR family transcriptional regulator [Acidimicrobiales bacterium]